MASLRCPDLSYALKSAPQIKANIRNPLRSLWRLSTRSQAHCSVNFHSPGIVNSSKLFRADCVFSFLIGRIPVRYASWIDTPLNIQMNCIILIQMLFKIRRIADFQAGKHCLRITAPAVICGQHICRDRFSKASWTAVADIACKSLN